MADDFLLDDEEDESTEQTQPDPKQNAAFAQMRKEKKALEKELEELRVFRAEREKADKAHAVSQVFKDIGLNPKWAGFYSGDDSSPEAVKAWAMEQEFLQPAEGEEAPAPVAPPATGFTPTVIEGGTQLGSKMYDADEFAKLLATDPKRAESIYRAGKLKKDEPDWAYQSRFYGRDT